MGMVAMGTRSDPVPLDWLDCPSFLRKDPAGLWYARGAVGRMGVEERECGHLILLRQLGQQDLWAGLRHLTNAQWAMPDFLLDRCDRELARHSFPGRCDRTATSSEGWLHVILFEGGRGVLLWPSRD
jgi:hypothetical protein